MSLVYTVPEQWVFCKNKGDCGVFYARCANGSSPQVVSLSKRCVWSTGCMRSAPAHCLPVTPATSPAHYNYFHRLFSAPFAKFPFTSGHLYLHISLAGIPIPSQMQKKLLFYAKHAQGYVLPWLRNFYPMLSILCLHPTFLLQSPLLKITLYFFSFTHVVISYHAVMSVTQGLHCYVQSPPAKSQEHWGNQLCVGRHADNVPSRLDKNHGKRQSHMSCCSPNLKIYLTWKMGADQSQRSRISAGPPRLLLSTNTMFFSFPIILTPLLFYFKSPHWSVQIDLKFKSGHPREL